MSSLSFVYLARSAGPSFEALAEDIAALTRQGDQVLIVEDSGDRDTAERIGRFTEQTGWGAGVAIHTILTGAPAQGDLGIAANLALEALSVPGMGRDRLVFLCGGARMDRAGFVAARAQAEAHDLDLLAYPLRQWSLDLGRVIDGPDVTRAADTDGRVQALMLRPGFDGMILRGPVSARCAEGQTNFGALRFWWQAISQAKRIEVYPEPLGHRAHPPEPDATLLHALTNLIAEDPSAAVWADQSLERLLSGLTPGAMTGLIEAGQPLANSVGPTARNTVLQVFATGDPDLARATLRSLGQQEKIEPISANQSLLSAPSNRSTPAVMRVHITGAHQHRQPFAYDNLTPLWEDRVALSEGPHDADLIVIAHPHNLNDLAENTATSIALGTPVALISEEPFWDTLFSPDPLAHIVTLPAAHLGAARVHQVNHHRSAIFDFARIPYFLLTDPGYVQRYAALFTRNAQLTAQDWANAFDGRAFDVTFMAERRPEAFHDLHLPGGDITGLCAWRTRLAEGCTQGRVQRLGASWGNGPSRFDLSDWHSDKITKIDGQTRILSGVENTHQPNYLSEKLFDAFACGARPAYFASPGHRAHDLGIPGEAWINLWGQSSDEAVASINSAAWNEAFYSAYAQAQAGLAALFNDPDVIATEQARLGRALVAEVLRLVDYGPA